MAVFKSLMKAVKFLPLLGIEILLHPGKSFLYNPFAFVAMGVEKAYHTRVYIFTDRFDVLALLGGQVELGHYPLAYHCAGPHPEGLAHLVTHIE